MFRVYGGWGNVVSRKNPRKCWGRIVGNEGSTSNVGVER